MKRIKKALLNVYKCNPKIWVHCSKCNQEFKNEDSIKVVMYLRQNISVHCFCNECKNTYLDELKHNFKCNFKVIKFPIALFPMMMLIGIIFMIVILGSIFLG